MEKQWFNKQVKDVEKEKEDLFLVLVVDDNDVDGKKSQESNKYGKHFHF